MPTYFALSCTEHTIISKKHLMVLVTFHLTFNLFC